MNKSAILLNMIYRKYSEHLEMIGGDAPIMVNHILANLLYKEMEENSFNKTIISDLRRDIERIKNECINPTNRRVD